MRERERERLECVHASAAMPYPLLPAAGLLRRLALLVLEVLVPLAAVLAVLQVLGHVFLELGRLARAGSPSPPPCHPAQPRRTQKPMIMALMMMSFSHSSSCVYVCMHLSD